MQEVPVVAAAADDGQVHYDFEFRGSGVEYFKIWSVNLLLTIITFGIFSAWAKVRNRRYFYGNTFLDNANFEYHANPWAILIARLLLAAVFIGGAYWAGESLVRNATHSLLLALFLPWAHVRGLAFNARYSSYRNIHFGFQKGNAIYMQMYLIYLPFIVIVLLQYLSALGLNFFDLYNTEVAAHFKQSEILWTLLPLFALPILLLVLLPWMFRSYHRLSAKNHRWGRLAARFTPPPLRIYMVCCWLLPFIGFSAVLVFYFLTFYIIGYFVTIDSDAGAALLVVITLLSYLLLVMIISMMFVQLFRLYWQSLVLPGEGRVQCNFTTKTFAAKIICVNYFAIVFSLGLLYPWTKVRKIRFLAQHMRLSMPAGAMDNVLAGMGSGEAALGSEFEAAEGFGFDFGLI